MKYLSVWKVLQLISILILSSDYLLVEGWTNEEFEMFDLVEELNSANFYEFLGVKNDATVKEIKSAYRQLSVKLHPDKNPDDPNAAIKFRQLVGVYEALKDEDLRKSYHQVLEFGLPNWRQPMFYFRRARKLAMWQVGILLLVIISTGQYLAAWGSYFEKKLSLQEMVETKLRKTQRSKKAQKEGRTVDEVTAELEQQYLIKPSLWNTAPIQLLRFGKYMIIGFPFDLVAYINEVKQERQEIQEQLLEQKRIEEEEENFVQEPKKPRKRKTFQAPEKEEGENVSPVEADVKKDAPVEPKQTFVSGGLWTDDDITLLIKLCSKYPGGVPDRWNTIANFMERPTGEVTHMAKRVLEDLSKRQVEEEEEEKIPVKVKVKTKASKADDELLEKVMSWGKEEQKRLEMALQMYPKGGSGDRWSKIASHVGKSKEECMQRFKYVADLVKKKKEKVELDAEVGGESKALNEHETQEVSASAPVKKASKKLPSPEVADVKKETVGRQNSSSSNYSGSDNEWCIVDEHNAT